MKKHKSQKKRGIASAAPPCSASREVWTGTPWTLIHFNENFWSILGTVKDEADGWEREEVAGVASKDEAERIVLAHNEGLISKPSTILPTESGFYWWRKTHAEEWQMVLVYDVGFSLVGRPVPGNRNWVFSNWAQHREIGEWLRVPEPNSELDRVPPNPGLGGCLPNKK